MFESGREKNKYLCRFVAEVLGGVFFSIWKIGQRLVASAFF
jgi:hypothetical protein